MVCEMLQNLYKVDNKSTDVKNDFQWIDSMRFESQQTQQSDRV